MIIVRNRTCHCIYRKCLYVFDHFIKHSKQFLFCGFGAIVHEAGLCTAVNMGLDGRVEQKKQWTSEHLFSIQVLQFLQK